MADALQAVMEEKLIQASEHWKDGKALPLPSQMFRMSAELVAEKDSSFSYALLSRITTLGAIA